MEIFLEERGASFRVITIEEIFVDGRDFKNCMTFLWMDFNAGTADGWDQALNLFLFLRIII